MSVGGDGKGKHEKEPNPSQNASTDSDEDVVVPVDDVPDVDVPPYDAVTEVMRAIDPNEPPPGSVEPTPSKPESTYATPVGPIAGVSVAGAAASRDSEPGDVEYGAVDEGTVSDAGDSGIGPVTAEPVHADPVASDPELSDPEPIDPDFTEPAATTTESTDPESVEPAVPDVAVPDATASGAAVDDTRTEEFRTDEGRTEHPSADEIRTERPDGSPVDGLSSEVPGSAASVTPERGADGRRSDETVDPSIQAYSALPQEDRIPSGTEAAASWPEDVDPSAQTVAQQVVEPVPAPDDTGDGRSSRVKIAVIAGAALAILGVFYAADMLSSNGSVPRGVTVAGIGIGGLSHDDAEAHLQSELGPRVEQPVRVEAGDQELELLPAASGLGVDWTATLDSAGVQPINPFTRIASFFTDREIGVKSTVDATALDGAVESIRAQTDRAPSEGDVVFEGATPVGVTPTPGQTVDVAVAREKIESDWAFGSVEVPVETVDVTVHQAEVDRVLAEVATPAVSAPVVFVGRDGAQAVLAPEGIATILSFEPGGEGTLEPRYDTAAATGQLAPQLVSTETPPKDASFALGGGAPTVVPGVVGELVQWPKTLEQLPTLLASTDSRTTEAVYDQAQPELTTEGAQGLGINEVIGEYTTGGFEYASGVNIRLTANLVNGALVKPGETFSLNDYTGPRGTAQGFVESGIIDNGRPDRAVGGGISQFATTLYNASYFGGMEDAGHTEHSYYISRYPEAREATVFEGAIDLQFTNTGKTGVIIEASASSSDVTVRLWGTKTVEVESITGSRSNPTSPNTITLPAGSACVPSGGGPGFTASDTRVITDIASGNEVSRDTRTVKYDPVPIVKCVSPEPDPEPEDEPADDPPSDAPPAEDGE